MNSLLLSMVLMGGVDDLKLVQPERAAAEQQKIRNSEIELNTAIGISKRGDNQYTNWLNRSSGYSNSGRRFNLFSRLRR